MLPLLALGLQDAGHAVSHARHRRDDPGFAEALAQCRDSDPDSVGERVRVLIPRALQQLFGTDDSALGADENLEHRELLARQRNVAAVAIDLAAERVHSQAADLSNGRSAVGAPAIERSEPEHQLLELERL